MNLFILDLTCAFLISVCNLLFPFIAQGIINVYVPNKELFLLILSLVIMLLIYLSKMVLGYIIQYWGHAVGVRMQADMRNELFAHLQRLPFNYFDDNQTGNIMSRLVDGLLEVKNPPILILDEATSALDNITEMQVQLALESLSKGRTTIVVAHRLSTVKNADKIILITENGVEERGTHEELIARNGMYESLYQFQFK